MTSIDDLQRELAERQWQRYRDLQRTAARLAFEKKHGRPAADLGELNRAFKSGTVATIRPEQYLDEATIQRVLSAATG